MPQLSPAQATPILSAGGIIAYPTEAVWGLGCDPFDQAAVLRLLAIKPRPVDKGLILVAASPAQLDELVDWDEIGRASWWERACRNEYVTGVAGSFNNK